MLGEKDVSWLGRLRDKASQNSIPEYIKYLQENLEHILENVKGKLNVLQDKRNNFQKENK